MVSKDSLLTVYFILQKDTPKLDKLLIINMLQDQTIFDQTEAKWITRTHFVIAKKTHQTKRSFCAH